LRLTRKKKDIKILKLVLWKFWDTKFYSSIQAIGYLNVQVLAVLNENIKEREFSWKYEI
jgi:hypothetical protein